MRTRNQRGEQKEWKKSPVKHYVSWNAGNSSKKAGYFEKRVYDPDTKEMDVLKLNIDKFVLVAEQISQINGFDDELGKNGLSFKSNLIDFTNTSQVITVKDAKGNKLFRGTYKELKENFKKDYKVHQVIIFLYEGELYQADFSGTSAAQWIEFAKNNKYDNKFYDNEIEVSFEDTKKGSNKFRVPVFTFGEKDEEKLKVAEELGNELSEYFEQFKNASFVKQQEQSDDETKQENEVVDKVPDSTLDSQEEMAEADIDDLPF